MPSNAPTRDVNSATWHDKILAQIPDRRNNAKFWERGLDTGVHVLGMISTYFTLVWIDS